MKARQPAISFGIALAAVLAMPQADLSTVLGSGAPQAKGQSGMTQPRTTSSSGKKLLAVIGKSQETASKLSKVIEGGFNAQDERNQKAVPLGIKGFEYDYWGLKNGSDDLAKGMKPSGIYLYAYVYGAPTAKEVFKNLGFDMSEWKKGPWIVHYEATKRHPEEDHNSGSLFSCKGYFVAIGARDDKQFTTIEVWKAPV